MLSSSYKRTSFILFNIIHLTIPVFESVADKNIFYFQLILLIFSCFVRWANHKDFILYFIERSNELYFLPQLSEGFETGIGGIFVVDLNLYAAFLLKRIVVFKFLHRHLHKTVVFKGRSHCLYASLELRGRRIIDLGKCQGRIVVGLPDDRSDRIKYFSVTRSGERLRCWQLIEFFINLSNNVELSFFKQLQILLLVPNWILLHGQVRTIIFFRFLEVIPFFEIKPVDFVIC